MRTTRPLPEQTELAAPLLSGGKGHFAGILAHGGNHRGAPKRAGANGRVGHNHANHAKPGKARRDRSNETNNCAKHEMASMALFL